MKIELTEKQFELVRTALKNEVARLAFTYAIDKRRRAAKNDAHKLADIVVDIDKQMKEQRDVG